MENCPMITTESLVKAGLFPNEQSVIDEALRVLWLERPQLRIDWAVSRYRSRDISLAKAAALAGVGFDKMKEILIQRGIQPRLGPVTIEEAREELVALDMEMENE